MQYRLSEIIAQFGGKLLGEDVFVSSIKQTDLAEKTDLSLISHKKYREKLVNCKAGALIIHEQEAEGLTIPAILTDNPRWYFSRVMTLFHTLEKLPCEIDDTAKIDPTSTIGEGASIASHVVIRANTVLGKNCEIYPNVCIGKNVIIGDNVKIYPNVTIYNNVIIGNDCTIHAGTVIGADGFGFAEDKNKHFSKILHVGGVIIGNHVEIGANTAIDSGTLTPTVVEDGVIIDNLVQVAHNVRIGAHTAIAGSTGIAGNVKIGKHCKIGGGCGINDHIEICDYTVVIGRATVAASITKPELYAGAIPARQANEWAKIIIAIKKIATGT